MTADLLLLTKAGPTQLRGVKMDVLEGCEELLVGKPEWETLGLPSPGDILLQRRSEEAPADTVVGRRVRRVKAPLDFEEQLEDDGDVPTLDDEGDFPSLSLGDQEGDMLEEEIGKMLQRATKSGASSQFISEMAGRLAKPLRDAFRTALGSGAAARVQVLDVELVRGAPLPRPPGMRRYSPAHKAAMATGQGVTRAWGHQGRHRRQHRQPRRDGHKTSRQGMAHVRGSPCG